MGDSIVYNTTNTINDNTTNISSIALYREIKFITMDKILYTKVFTKHSIELWIDTDELSFPTIYWNRRLNYVSVMFICMHFTYYYK